MFELIEGKVRFTYEKEVKSYPERSYSCICSHDGDIVNSDMYTFLEYHWKENHIMQGDLTCPKCLYTIYDKEKFDQICIACGAHQFIGSTYINVYFYK